MAQTGYTPISLYHSTTATTVPTGGNLANGELALNIADADMTLYAKNNTGNVIRLMNNPSNLKYPTVDGSSGQYIITNGLGVLSWSSFSLDPVLSTNVTVTSPLAWNSNGIGMLTITALANNLTFSIDAGSPTDGKRFTFRIKDNGTARALTWPTGTTKSFRAVGVTLPTQTVSSKTVYIGCVYNGADSRWDVIAVAQEV